MPEEIDDLLGPAEIESLLSAAFAEDTPLLEDSLPEFSGDAEIAPDLTDLLALPSVSPLAALPEFVGTDGLAAARPFALPAFDPPAGESPDTTLPVADIADVELQIELGRTDLTVEDCGQLRQGSIVSLDKLAADPVDILVDGRLVARGEVLILKEKFCIRVAEVFPAALTAGEAARSTRFPNQRLRPALTG